MEIEDEISEENTMEEDPWKDEDSVSAQELFSYCDFENKGSITCIDMERLCNIVPFNKLQVEQMFNCMDKGKNGEIGLDEFMSGFNALLEVSSSPAFRRSKKRLHPNGRALSPIKEMGNDLYEEFIDLAGHPQIFKHDERLRKLFDDLKTENPSLVPEFEKLVEKIASEFEIGDVQRNKLELQLQTCGSLQDEQLEQLYQNLERRMKEEKAKATAEMEKKIAELISEETERKRKNIILLKEQNQLERKVISTEKMLAETEIEIKGLNEEDLETKKRREREANKELLDENDTKTYSDSTHDHSTFFGSKFHEMNASFGDSTATEIPEVHTCLSPFRPSEERISLQMDSLSPRTANQASSQHSSSRSSSISSVLDYIGINDGDEYKTPLSTFSKVTWKVTCILLPEDSGEQKEYWKVKLTVVPLRDKMIICPQVVESNSCELLSSDVCDGLTTPERIFKIIFVGDSGVGKTSFIQRFCNDSFKTNFHSTIGIDFRVKSIVVNNKCISLQLWDTAGQERFRCISKQYFRKSDAVIVMYDVTSEKTFRNIRQWFAHIKDNAEDDAVILLLGNKVDARKAGQYFIVSKLHGARLAKEYGTLFFETSAKTGTNINEAMIELSSLLQEKEDLDMTRALILDEVSQKKRWRC